MKWASKKGFVCACAVLLAVPARSASAYIDPGTGGAVFGSLLPILGVMLAALLGCLVFLKGYVGAAARFVGRHWVWFVLALAALGIGLALALWGGRSEGRAAAPPAAGTAPARATHAPLPVPDGKRGAPKMAVPEDPANDTGTPAMDRALKTFSAVHDADARPAESFHLFGPDEYPEVTRGKYELNHRVLSCFSVRRPATIAREVVPGRGQRLLFCVGAVVPADEASHEVVGFRLSAAKAGGGAEELLSRRWEAGPGEREWERVAVDLDKYAGERLTLRFEVAVEGSLSACLLSDPRLVGPAEGGGLNVLFCSIESLRRDDTSLHGYGRKTTPFLEKLAEEAVVFDSAYAQSSWTRPSVATLLSGLYPSQHGAVLWQDRLKDDVALLPELLRREGYATAGFCSCEVISRQAFNYDQGFDLFVDEGSRLAEEIATDVLDWLDEDSGRPFFAYVHFFDPHGPYDAPGAFKDRFDPDYGGRLKDGVAITPSAIRYFRDLSPRDKQYVRARYDGEIAYTDSVLAELAQGLKQRGLWDSTLLVITSDHGEELGEHGDWGHGRALFPETLMVPLIVKLPHQQRGGARVAALASGVDVVPTVLSALDLPVPEHLPGVDLLGPSAAAGPAPREFHFAELRPTYAVLTNRFGYILARDASGRLSEFLFDLSADPLGLRNVASELPEVRTRLAGLIAARYGSVGYTIAVNGGGPPAAFSGTVRSEARIVQADGLRTEEGDSFEAAPDGKSLRFALNVAGDDDVLRFQTEPANAAVSIELMLDGAVAPAELVHLGPLAARCEGWPLEVPAERCAVDADLSEARKYGAGKELGVYIWRTGTPHAGVGEAKPDEETLKALKNLGYL